jgi:Abnormal spindle-like microcephaly-assoc'd, ASPM-SPD-2-Hydin
MHQASPSTTTTTTTSKSATLSLNESSIDFGSVQDGSSKSSSLTLTNSSASGGPSVTFSQVSATGTGFSATTASLPIVLAAGESSTISIVFSPRTPGAVNGALSITVDGATDPASVPLTGTGLGPSQLGASPSALSFGSVAVGSSLNKTGTLTAGSSDVVVASAAWSGQGYSVSGLSFPVTILAGKSLPYTVTFAPEAAGASQGSVSFISNAANSPTTESFSGTGSQTQSTNPTVQPTVQLSWNPSTSSIIGYNTYRSSQSGGPYTKLDSSPGAAPSYTDSTVQAGQTYYYVVTSVDSDSVESAYSNQATAVVPNP